MDLLGYVLASVILVALFSGLFSGSGGGPPPPPSRALKWSDFSSWKNFRAAFWPDTRPRCDGGCGTVIRDRSYCAACAARVTAASKAKREKQAELDRMHNELERRERQRLRREAAKLAKTSPPPKTGPIVVPKGQPYRP